MSRSSTRRPLFLVLALVIALFAACSSAEDATSPEQPTASSVEGTSGGESTPTTGGDDVEASGPPIEPEVRATVVEGIVDFANTVTGVDHAEAHDQIVQYLLSLPEIVDAGVSDDEIVWGRFTDGTLHVHIDNVYEREEPAADTTSGSPTLLPIVGRAPLGTFATDSGGEPTIPASTEVTILEAYGPLDAGVGDMVGPWLSNAGYTVTGFEATLDQMLAIQPVGVFLYNGHGGDVDGHFVLSSTTPVNADNNYTFQEQLHDKRVVTASVGWQVNRNYDPNTFDCFKAWAFDEPKPANCKSLVYKSVYAVTEKVVEEWQFSDGALVVLNACSSTALTETILNKPNVGAFAGWTEPVAIRGAPRVLGLFFDRLLGLNVKPPDEWPDMRPFDAGSVFEYMSDRNQIIDPLIGKAALSVVERRPTILIPSIELLDVHEETNEMFIEGLFGSRNGEVEIEGNSLEPNWGPETVVVKIEDTGPTAAGEVTVIVDGRKSNPVPLTEWRGKLYYSADVDGLAKGLGADVTFDVHLRADVHLSREDALDDPSERRVEIRAAGDSTGPWEVHGSASQRGATMTLRGNGIMEVEETQPDHEQALFAIFGTLVAGVPGSPPTIEDLRIHAHFASDPAARLLIEAPGAPAIDSGFPLPQSSVLSDVVLTFDTDFAILADQIEGESMGIPGPAVLNWDRIPANSQPSLDDPPQAGVGMTTASSGESMLLGGRRLG